MTVDNAEVRTFTVAVVGFNLTERIVLQSIFSLAARRNPKYVQWVEGSAGQVPDILLVEGEGADYMEQLRVMDPDGSVPTVIVGDKSPNPKWAVMARPLQWSRLLQLLDQSASTIALPAAVQAQQPSDRVLVVDDSLPVRKFMEAKLAPFNFAVDFAESGEQAVGLTVKNQYTCVFLDVIMPGADGYQVCKLIKANKQKGKAPAVVMLTSKSSPFDRLRGTMAGCDAYLTKPVDEGKLLATVSKFILNRERK
jgi:twitching motility two-component system response regulator PilG